VWYQKAAALGDPVHIYNLGMCYSQGMGTSPDIPLAIEWYQRAAAQRHAGSCRNLSTIYYRGKGTIASDSYWCAYWRKCAALYDDSGAPTQLSCTQCTCRSQPIIMDIRIPPMNTSLTITDSTPVDLDDEQRAAYNHGITIHELILWRRLALRFSDNSSRIYSGTRDDRSWCPVPTTHDGGISDDPPDEPLLTTLEGVWLGVMMSEEMYRLRQLATGVAASVRIVRPLHVTINRFPLAVLIHCWQSNVLPLPQPIFVQILSFLDEV
jgi:hypothetical protein